jgi:hypothetical protein
VTDRVAEAVKGQQFEIIQTNLSKVQEAKLRANFGEEHVVLMKGEKIGRKKQANNESERSVHECESEA